MKNALRFFRGAAGFALGVLGFVAPAADPYLGYLYPSGSETGRSIRLLAGGQNLGGIHSGVVTGGGVTVRKVTPVPDFPPPDGDQRKYLLAWIKNIESGNPVRPKPPENTDTWRKNEWWDKLDKLDPLSLNLVIRDLHTTRNALQAAPSIRQQLIVDLDIAPGAKPGVRELRLWGNRGVSGPKLFFIDAARHIAEPEFTAPDKPDPPPPRVTVIPSILDGQILPGETDRFKLRLEENCSYTLSLDGRRLLPFIGDAVPGFFQPVLRLLGPDGKEAAFADDEYFNPDPVLRFRAPKSGEYTLEVRDNLYRGRADFVYRILVEPGIRPYRLTGEPFTGLPLQKAAAAEKRPLASGWLQVIDGNVEPNRPAVFRISGKAGRRLVADVAARRCGSPLDGVLRLYGPDGKLVAEADDSPSELNIGTCLQQVDPYLNVELPVNGDYRLELFDRTGSGGADWKYRMRIGPPQPDFEAYTTASMLNLPPGGKGTLKLDIVRKDGFDGEIRFRAEGAELVGDRTAAAGENAIKLELKNPGSAAKQLPPGVVRLFGEAVVGGKKVEKAVIPCDEFMQAFAYTHLLPAEEFRMGTLRRADDRKDRKK